MTETQVCDECGATMALHKEAREPGTVLRVFLCPSCGAYLYKKTGNPRLVAGFWVVSGQGNDADYGYIYGSQGDQLAVSWFGSMSGGTLDPNDPEPWKTEDEDEAHEEFLARFNGGSA